jgi:acetyl esterase
MTTAQLFPGLSETARARMLELGPLWATDIVANRKAVLEIYTPVLASKGPGDVEVTRNQAYGAHARQCLDVYRSPGASNAPVVVFIHGGAFLRGEKDSNTHIYGNLPRYFARNGCVGVNVEYRLAPEAAYPEGTRDVAQAVQWVRDNIQASGGDPARIFLVGHSAGGAHAAAYVCDPVTKSARGHGVAGLVLISARLRADARPDNPNAHGVRAYYGADEALYEERSVVTHAENMDVPLLLAVAEYENPGLDTYALEMYNRLKAAGDHPRFMRLEAHNHTSMVAHFDTDEDTLGREILEFIEKAE